MASVYHIVAIRVNETSWEHVWRLRFRYLGTGCDKWKVFGPDILHEVKKQVRMVRENLRVLQSRQKSYADHRGRELCFEVGDFAYLKVSPMSGLHRFKVQGHSRFWRREMK
jgi:hypothetical protein